VEKSAVHSHFIYSSQFSIHTKSGHTAQWIALSVNLGTTVVLFHRSLEAHRKGGTFAAARLPGAAPKPLEVGHVITLVEGGDPLAELVHEQP
jgi:hypothetical protein